jgi:hypothetical protein
MMACTVKGVSGTVPQMSFQIVTRNKSEESSTTKTDPEQGIVAGPRYEPCMGGEPRDCSICFMSTLDTRADKETGVSSIRH